MRIYNVIRRWIVIVLSPIILLSLSGCWSSIELNERAFVEMMVIDKSEQDIELTLGFPLPNRTIPGTAGGSGETSGKPYTFITNKGKDIGQAFRNIQSDISRRVTFGQTRIVIVGRKMAEDGIGPVLDFLGREAKLHLNAKVFITPGKTNQIMSTPTIFERFPSDILTAYSTHNMIINASVKDFLVANHEGGDILAPMLTFKMKQITSEKDSEQTWMGTDGAAIFASGKMVGSMNPIEMRGGLWISGQLQDAEISIPSPTDGKYMSFMVHRVHTKVKPQIENEQVKITIQSKANVDVLSSNSNIDLYNLKQLKILENILGREVELRMTKAIDKTRKVRSDAFHLGNYIDWNYPGKWRDIKLNWRELYSQTVNIEIKTNISITNLGTLKQTEKIVRKEE